MDYFLFLKNRIYHKSIRYKIESLNIYYIQNLKIRGLLDTKLREKLLKVSGSNRNKH